MWMVPLLFFLSESTSLWILVERAWFGQEITFMISGMEDGMVTAGAYEKLKTLEA